MSQGGVHTALAFRSKNAVLAMLVILGMVTFLDRINISVAGSAIMADLALTPAQWGWVQSGSVDNLWG